MSEITDAQRLMARGKDMTLADGSIHTVRLGARPQARIEDDYGSIEAFIESLRAGKRVNGVAYVLHITLGIPKEQAIGLVDTRRLKEYFEVITEAITESMPPVPVRVRILQNHEIGGDRYRAGTEVEVTSDRAKHLIDARVAKSVEVASGNLTAAPGSASPGAASSMSPSAGGTSTPSASGT